MELYEFHILKWQSCSRDHRASITSARMGASSTEVCSSITYSSQFNSNFQLSHLQHVLRLTTSSQHCVPCEHAMTRAILHIHRRNAHTLPLTHHQIQRKPLHKKLHSLF
jgi:hypothetical protein